ncbi:MAG: serine hydrolase domain-containing protein, partial [Verrucomicrobiota bacterium]
AIQDAIEAEKLPGAVLHLEAKGHVYRQVYGKRGLKPKKEDNSADTIYDLASLTKVMATAPSVMKLIERGTLDLDQTVNSVLPDFEGHGKKGITIRQLLTHTSGLHSGFPKDDRPGSYRKALIRINESEPKVEPGTDTIYSDLNFILLGEIVRKVSGDPLADYAHREIWAPARMWETTFLPDKSLRSRIAPTEKLGLSILRGEVHDPTSRLMGGITGHAGAFSQIDDVVRFARMMLNGGVLDGVQILREATVKEMTRIHAGGRGLGFDLDSSLAELPRGKHFEVGKSYGHTGWTGTGMWIDPTRDMFLVMLANRNHPRGGDVRQLRHDVATLAVEAAENATLVKNEKGTPGNGIDVLVEDDFLPLAGLKVGLITNHTGLSWEG